MNVFTYGSLQYPEVMYSLVKNQYEKAGVLLRNHSRRQVKGQCYPGLMVQENSNVEGIIYLNVTAEDLEILHHFEGDEYKQVMVTVEGQDGNNYQALAYLYGNVENLLPSQWDSKKFQAQNKHSFAQDHLGTKEKP